jgi:hypothetical protein
MINRLLTIDLDYWTITSKFNKSHTDFLHAVIKKTKKVQIIEKHHHLVTKRMIPKSTDEIINIDFHNDIVDECPRKYLNEGTWGNFLPKRVKKFTWIYPDKDACINELRGVCSGLTTMRPEITHVDYVEQQGYKNIKIDSIQKLVVCISEDWAEHPTEPYLKFLKPYLM